MTSSADVLRDRVDKALHEWIHAARPSVASISPDLEPFVDTLAAFVRATPWRVSDFAS